MKFATLTKSLLVPEDTDPLYARRRPLVGACSASRT